jgi:hypothetical protein
MSAMDAMALQFADAIGLATDSDTDTTLEHA